MEILFIWTAIGTVLGLVIGSAKGRPGVGFLLGFLFGLIGVLIVAVLPAEESAAARDARLARDATVMASAFSAPAASAPADRLVVKVRCPSCRELCDETARFCAGCGGSIAAA